VLGKAKYSLYTDPHWQSNYTLSRHAMRKCYWMISHHVTWKKSTLSWL